MLSLLSGLLKRFEMFWNDLFSTILKICPCKIIRSIFHNNLMSICKKWLKKILCLNSQSSYMTSF
jgi:hypothetical protein